MDFTVPQFIEREPKLIGPFNFKQFMYVAIAGGACFFLYFFIAEKNFILFVFIALLLMGGALALGFLKIKGYDLPSIVKNFLVYVISPKIFIWKRKIIPPKIQKIERLEKDESEEGVGLKMAQKSRLQRLFTRVETKKRK